MLVDLNDSMIGPAMEDFMAAGLAFKAAAHNCTHFESVQSTLSGMTKQFASMQTLIHVAELAFQRKTGPIKALISQASSSFNQGSYFHAGQKTADTIEQLIGSSKVNEMDYDFSFLQ